MQDDIIDEMVKKVARNMGVCGGTLPRDIISPEMFKIQADIAEAAGKRKLAESLRLAAENAGS